MKAGRELKAQNISVQESYTQTIWEVSYEYDGEERTAKIFQDEENNFTWAFGDEPTASKSTNGEILLQITQWIVASMFEKGEDGVKGGQGG